MARFIVLILFSLNLYSQIKLDGKVDVAEWQNSEKYTLDYEIEPSYNGPAEHKTEAFVKHDDSYLYLSLIHISEPKRRYAMWYAVMSV